MGTVTFVILSFEGPDTYSHAGGLGSRVTELSEALASIGIETHLFFIGDPALPGHETLNDGLLHLHRWCQWISAYHPMGVYDGEEGKLRDWERSLPAWLEIELIGPKVSSGEAVVVLAEEWQTAGALLALHRMVERRGWQKQVRLLWNANNLFSFHRIDLRALSSAATLTTVSRFMRHEMWKYGVDARVIPNGISEIWLRPLKQREKAALQGLFTDRLALAKVARWDPDKRWNMAVDAVADLKRLGHRPLLLARGGVGAHRFEVFERAQRRGLGVASIHWSEGDVPSLVEALKNAVVADVVNMQGYLTQPQRRALFHTVDAVLANSGMEPFGLVGLETMAVEGVAFVGCTGEDYVTPGHDAISIQSDDPNEIVYQAVHLKESPEQSEEMRLLARQTAERYTWRTVIRRVLLPFLAEKGLQVDVPPDVWRLSCPLEEAPDDFAGDEGGLDSNGEQPQRSLVGVADEAR
ncbi:MAG: glycosyltransferase family 4 protein [Chloroflexi bacterium]|nr:glycosyltransferase family 4 protein [Chloroflexota bacterium]